MRHALLRPTKIYVSKSSIKGRGVFAAENISEGEVVEECHFIISGKDINEEFSRYFFSIFIDPALTPEENSRMSLGLWLQASAKSASNPGAEMGEVLEDFGYKDPSKLINTAAVLGFGMIYNHSEEPNIEWTPNIISMLFEYQANRSIEKGEELFINYGPAYLSGPHGI